MKATQQIHHGKHTHEALVLPAKIFSPIIQLFNPKVLCVIYMYHPKSIVLSDRKQYSAGEIPASAIRQNETAVTKTSPAPAVHVVDEPETFFTSKDTICFEYPY